MPVSVPANGWTIEEGAELGVAEIRYPYELRNAMHAAGWDHLMAINDWRERNKDNPFRTM